MRVGRSPLVPVNGGPHGEVCWERIESESVSMMTRVGPGLWLANGGVVPWWWGVSLGFEKPAVACGVWPLAKVAWCHGRGFEKPAVALVGFENRRLHGPDPLSLSHKNTTPVFLRRRCF